MPPSDTETSKPAANLIIGQTIATESQSSQWQLIGSEAEPGALPPPNAVVPLHLWRQHRTELLARGNCAVWLDSDQPPALLGDDIAQFDLIAINFPVFADGRGYSYATTLRSEYNYEGEIRAIGDVLPDQLLYMQRCGFNAYELRGDRDPNTALARFDDLTEYYQSAYDQPQPLFSRRV